MTSLLFKKKSLAIFCLLAKENILLKIVIPYKIKFLRIWIGYED